MTATADLAPMHFWLRRVYYMAAGAAGCLLLSGIALHAFRIEWSAIGILALVGTLAAVLDVFVFERHSTHKLRTCLFWACGFVIMSVMMMIALLIPYVILAVLSKLFGIWQDWEMIAAPGQYLPIPIGAAFGLLIWHILDDY